MIKIPVGKLIKLIGKLISVAPGGINHEERDELVALLLSILADIAPDHININLPG